MRGITVVAGPARTHVAARAVLERPDAPNTVLAELGRTAAEMEVAPASVNVFGSFARGEAGRDSDSDVVFVRPPGINEDDDHSRQRPDAGRTGPHADTSGDPTGRQPDGTRTSASHGDARMGILATRTLAMPRLTLPRRSGRVVLGRNRAAVRGCGI